MGELRPATGLVLPPTILSQKQRNEISIDNLVKVWANHPDTPTTDVMDHMRRAREMAENRSKKSEIAFWGEIPAKLHHMVSVAFDRGDRDSPSDWRDDPEIGPIFFRRCSAFFFTGSRWSSGK